MAKSAFQRLLDAGVEFSDLSKKQAEGIVSSLVKSGEIRRRDAKKAVKQLLDRGKATSERAGDSVQREVAKQMTWLAERFDDIEGRFEDFVELVTDRDKAPAEQAPAKKAPAKKASAKKNAPAKKASAKKKAPARKTPAKKTVVKKAAPAGDPTPEPESPAAESDLATGNGTVD